MRERYIRPPLVAPEPRSERVAVWRFRALLLLALVALAVVCLVLVLQLSPGGEGAPGIGG